MSTDFRALVDRLHKGESDAAEQIVRQYEPEIRRIVRSRLRDPRLRRVVDSMDICQSVFGRFFVQVTVGGYDLNSEKDLVKLLTRMATNKVIDKHRTEDSQRRLVQSRIDAELEGTAPSTGSTLPESPVVFDELFERIQERLSEREREVSRLRTQGMSWMDIAKELGESPQAVRKRLERACIRVTKELGID